MFSLLIPLTSMKTNIVILAIILLGIKPVCSKNHTDIKNGVGSGEFIKDTKNNADSVAKVIPVYFILGTLSDYIGRFYAVERSLQVDQYQGPEKPMVDYLEVLIKDQPGMKVDSLVEKKNGYRRTSDLLSKKYLLYSDELSKVLNNFYGKDDKLTDSLFTTDEQIYSFLAGVYYRYGDRLDSSIYKIQMANSSKHQNCQAFLEKVGCKKVVYKFLNNIPSQHILYFTPTAELLSYFNEIEQEKMLLRESNLNGYQELFNYNTTKEELEKSLRNLKEKELNNIKGEFKL